MLITDVLPLLNAYCAGNYDVLSNEQTKLSSYLIFFDLPRLDELCLILGKYLAPKLKKNNNNNISSLTREKSNENCTYFR